jgi:hypothetical protein
MSHVMFFKFNLMFLLFHITFFIFHIIFLILTCACFEQDVKKVEECHEEALWRKEYDEDGRHPFSW